MLPLAAPTTVMLFLLHDKSDALQLCKHTNRQFHKAISPTISFPKCKVEIIIHNYPRKKNTIKCGNDRCSKSAMQLSLLIRLLQTMNTTFFHLNLYFLDYILIFCNALTTTK